MIDCSDRAWDDYFTLCQQHEQLLKIADRTKSRDARDEAYKVHLRAYNALKKIRQEGGPEKEDPTSQRIIEYLRSNPMCSVNDVTVDLSIDADQLRVVMTKYQKKIGMDGSGGIVRLWWKREAKKLTEDQVDILVRTYLKRMRSMTVDDCAFHIGVKAPTVRKSLLRLGVMPVKGTDGHATTFHYEVPMSW